MLTARGTALAAGDAEGYLADLSPEARAFEEPIARGGASLPLASVELTLDPSLKVDEDTSIDDASVDLIYRYDGLPAENTFRFTLLYDLAHDDGSWGVRASKLKGGSALPIWVTGPIAFMQTDHFLALFRPGLTEVEATLKLAEEARQRLSTKVTFPLENGFLMLLGRDRQQYEEFSSRDVAASAVAQAETVYEITTTSIETESRQIVLNLQQLRTEEASIETFQHELGHLALTPQTRPFTPPWLGEAAAMYLADTRPTRAWRAGLRSGRFNELSFTTLTRQRSLGAHDETASAEYAYAAGAAHYLVEAFGAEKFWEFYGSFADVPSATVYEGVAGKDSASTDAALSELAAETSAEAMPRIFGFDEARLDILVREWIDGEV